MTRAGVNLNASHRLGEPLPARVAILRALQLGDLLCAVPAFRALRAALPDAELVLVGLPWAREFVDRYSEYLDGFREFPGYPGLPERAPEVARVPVFLAEMQAERFDLAVQMHGSGLSTNPVAVLFGARRTAGFYVREHYCPDPERFLPWPESGLEIRRLLKLLEFLGISSVGEELDFPVSERDHRALRAVEGTGGLRPGSYVCVHPGASVPPRRWPAERFAEAAEALGARGFRVVLTGTAGEAELTRAVGRRLSEPPLDLAGKTGLGALAALLQGARLLVCNDTGVSHVAAALHTPSVVISTGNNPQRWAPIDGRRHRMLCRDEGVSPGEVIHEAEGLLRNGPGGSGRLSESAPGPTAGCLAGSG